MKDYEKVYEDFWKDIVEKDGELDKDLVMRELADFRIMINDVPKVYMEVANLSKPLTRPEAIIGRLYEDFVRREDILDDMETASEDGYVSIETIRHLLR